MPDNQTLELLINAGLPTLAALAVLVCATAIVLTSRSNGRIQRDLVKVLNKQMDNETKRDKREIARQDEAERHNKRLEDLLESLIKKEDERYIKIGDALESISQSQEEIKQGVEEMNSQELAEALRGITELLEIINNKLDALTPPSPTADPITSAPKSKTNAQSKPFTGSGAVGKTQPLATPGLTVKEQKAIDKDKNKD